MRHILTTAAIVAAMLLCGTEATAQDKRQDKTMTEKRDMGSLMALYPKPLTVVGAMVNGKANWLIVGHTGIIGHDRIMVSMSKSHYTNQGIIKTGRLSVNLVSREMLPQADYVGSVSGAQTDKSAAFAYHTGAEGAPVIDMAPVSMECCVEDNYETEGFDNFICRIAHTYADESVLDSTGRLDYTRLKPVLFDFPTYSYIATGEVIGKCLHMDRSHGMCAKQPMSADGITRPSRTDME